MFQPLIKHYTQDDFQWYPNNSHFCLGMIFDCCGARKQKKLKRSRAATIKWTCPALDESKSSLSLLNQFNKIYT